MILEVVKYDRKKIIKSDALYCKIKYNIQCIRKCNVLENAMH